jgi:hypothetical protein
MGPMKTPNLVNDIMAPPVSYRNLHRSSGSSAAMKTTRVIEEGLQPRLRAQQVSAKPVRLPVYRGKGGLASGLSGLSNKAMLDAADQDA